MIDNGKSLHIVVYQTGTIFVSYVFNVTLFDATHHMSSSLYVLYFYYSSLIFSGVKQESALLSSENLFKRWPPLTLHFDSIDKFYIKFIT